MADAKDYLLHAALGVLSGGQKAYQRHIDIEEADELSRRKLEMEEESKKRLLAFEQPLKIEQRQAVPKGYYYDETLNQLIPIPAGGKLEGKTNVPALETPEQKLERSKELETFKVDIAGKKKQQEVDIEKTKNRPKALKALESYDESIQNTIKNIDEVLNDPKFSRGAGLLGSVEAKVKGSPAFNIRAKIKSIESAVGLDQLTELRANSPTGGALGNVSDKDIALLTSAKKNLDPDQDAKELRKALLDLRDIIESSTGRATEAYQSDFGVPYQRRKKKGLPALSTPTQSAPEVDQFLKQNPGSKFLGYE